MKYVPEEEAVMSEREVRARLHPHTGQVEVQPVDDSLEFLAGALMDIRALRMAIKTLARIADKPEWPQGMSAVIAKTGLEQIEALLVPPPNLRPATWDHAGPDY